MKEIFAMMFVLWLTVFGFSMILGQHAHFARWTTRALREVVNFISRQFRILARWAWRNYRQGIVGFVAGTFATLYFTGRLP